MWSKIVKALEELPERLKVARLLVENGLSVRAGRVYLKDIEIPPVRIARIAGVDRRTVKETVNAITAHRELGPLFEGLRPAGHSLKEIARHLNFGVVEITPKDASTPGILAGAANILAKHGLSIRQAIVDDPELSPEPKLSIIVEKKIPGELVPRFLKIKGVDKVSIY